MDEEDRQTRLHYKDTKSSRLKKRALENVYDLFDDLESVVEDSGAMEEDDEDDGDEEGKDGKFPGEAATIDGVDPTYEMANVRRFIIGKEPVSKLVENTREMFRLQVITLIFYASSIWKWCL